MDLELGMAIVRVLAGLGVAAHGAQKVFAWQEGPGLEKWTGAVGQVGFRPARYWALAAAYGELVGGLLFAAGLLTGVAAGVLLVDIIVAIWKVHFAKGFFATKGGYEHTLTWGVIFGVFGLMGAGLYSLDAALGLARWTMALFAVTVVLGFTGVWAATRPAAVERIEEERRRRAA